VNKEVDKPRYRSRPPMNDLDLGPRPERACSGPASVAPVARSRAPHGHNDRGVGPDGLPRLLTADETAELLRTSRRGVYAMAERAQLPGAIRIGRRLLVRRDELLGWLGLQEEEPTT
jgi:excisionase family DNA binding protein